LPELAARLPQHAARLPELAARLPERTAYSKKPCRRAPRSF
jgi:hypothetical protein